MFHHPAAMVDYATATLLASRLALEFGHGQSRPAVIAIIAASVAEMGDTNDFVRNASEMYDGDCFEDDGAATSLDDPAAQAIFDFGGDSTILENEDEFRDFKQATPHTHAHARSLIAHTRGH